MTEFDATDFPEVPEADRVEQNVAIDGESDGDVDEQSGATSMEVNEADAAEQNREVPDDEDYPRG